MRIAGINPNVGLAVDTWIMHLKPKQPIVKNTCSQNIQKQMKRLQVNFSGVAQIAAFIEKFFKKTPFSFQDRRLIKKHMPSWLKGPNIRIYSKKVESWIEDDVFQGGKTIGRIRRQPGVGIMDLEAFYPNTNTKNLEIRFIFERIKKKKVKFIKLKAITNEDKSKAVTYFKDNGKIDSIAFYDAHGYYVPTAQQEPTKVKKEGIFPLELLLNNFKIRFNY